MVFNIFLFTAADFRELLCTPPRFGAGYVKNDYLGTLSCVIFARMGMYMNRMCCNMNKSVIQSEEVVFLPNGRTLWEKALFSFISRS